MRGYEVKLKGVGTVAWTGSMADCRMAKAALVDSGRAEKSSQVTYEEVEVPSDKAGLLKFLNERCVAPPVSE